MTIVKRIAILLGITVLISSCTSIIKLRERDFDRVLQDLKEPQSQETGQIKDTLSLDDAKTLALKKNPDLKSAIFRVEQAMARLSQAKSAYYPSVGVSGGYHHTEWQPSLNNPFAMTGRSQTYRASLNVSWLLFDGLRREAIELASQLAAEASEASAMDVRRLLCKGVAQAYLSLLLQQELVRIAEADRDFTKKLLDDTQLRLENKLASRPDVMNFQVRYNEALINAVEARTNLATARVVLAELLGLQNAELPDNLKLSLPEGPSADLKFIASEQIERALLRPDLQALARQRAAAEANVEAARGALYPTLAAVGDYGYMGENDPRFSREDRAGSAGAVIEWDFDITGAKRAALAEAKSASKEIQELLQSRYNAVCSEIRQEVARLSAAQEQVKLYNENIKLSTELRNVETLRWEEGQVSITRLNEVQTSLIRTEARAAVARIQLLLSWENLRAGTNDNVPASTK